ncbi:alpha/beta fold hydrolase [Natrialbaceae archaeon AArc-T1-2]|uniref:alpha/beta fold hydrolase n=1 Tax=Natrialbaceae archaeon AArc-T1-2 TaxID=3053904 RepID=UPI00255B3469|nr:alpha/beta fold hydrolase [Natrialbaceae archaeon AArc-T1-2]WIV66885.1 alpha/beta fold hydrolase [Natrialbaceae archaeon AArc-T1-2]
MDPFEPVRQVSDRAARAPTKLAQLPLRTRQLARAEPGQTPYTVVHEEPLVDLRRYEPAAVDATERRAPIMIVYPFINDPSILDFRPERSVIRGFLERGFPVYVLEWTDASPLDRSRGLDDVVGRTLARCVAFARRDADAEAVHLLGYSTGAPLAAAYAGLYSDTVRTLTLQGAPLDFDAGGSVGQLRSIARRLDLEQVAETFDVVPASFLEAGFVLRKPVEYAITNPLRLWDRFDDDEYVEDVARKLAWTVDGPAIPAAFFREFVRRLLVENRLVREELCVNGRTVALEDVSMPVLLVVGRDDAFVPPEASVPFLDVIGSEDTEVREFPTGHVGLSTAPDVHDADGGWPSVRDWLVARE